MSLNYVTLTFTEQDAADDAGTGPWTIAPTSVVTAAGVTVVSQAPVVRTMSGGTLSVSLVACDSAGTTPAAGFWAYLITPPGGQPLPYLVNFANGATQRFDNLTPAVASVTYGPAAGSGTALPLTTLGDILYEDATPAPARLAGSTSSAKQFLTQTGTGSASAPPAWEPVVPSDLAPAGSPAPSKYAGLTYGAVWGWPWRFWPDTRGAKGDGRVFEDATVTSGALTTLKSPAQANYTSADVGKSVLGWTGSAWYAATVTAYNSPISVTISPAVPGAFANMGCVIATDDTAAFNAIRADAYTYALGGPQEAEIYVPPLPYGLAAAASTAYSGNAQIQLPALDPATQLSVSLSVRSDGVPAGPRHWLQTSHDLPGAVLLCMRTDGTLDATYGPACVIGGPFNTYGGGSQKFSNARFALDGITVAVPYPSGYSGVILRGVGQMEIGDYSVLPLGSTPSGGPWPQYVAGGPATDQWTVGLWAPDVGNNAVADLGRYTCYGMEVALAGSEHLDWDSFRSVFNGFGVIPVNAAGGGSVCHGISGRNFACEETSTPIGVLTSGPYASVSPIGLTIQKMDLETYSTPAVMDNGGFLTGKARFGDNQGPGHYYGTPLVTAGSPFKLVNYNTAPGILSSPQAPPASGSPWLNGYYQDAEITLSVSAGTLSGLLTDAAAESLPASCTLYKFTVPSGHTYTPTFTGTLTHKVKLLGP